MTMTQPHDLPLVERNVVRLIVLDVDDRILLFRIREPLYPEEGTCWELPGGGIDAGETYVSAGVRELREETGIQAEPGNVGAPAWWRRATFRHAGTRRLQNEVVVVVRLGLSGPAVDETKQLAEEKETYCGFRWWSVSDIEASAERFYPGSLPAYVRRVLAGEQIEEPFEYFS
jgi:8-oxo-dGTP pyrophosphatase MutT (NUDIX family)